MIRALWFIVKLSLIVALAVWIADRPGFVQMEWLNYSVRIDMGLFLVLFLAVVLLSILIYSLLRGLADLPGIWRRQSGLRNREKGHRALMLGLTAVAVGDPKAATAQARLTQKLLGEDDGLALLLQAQAARLEGLEDRSREIFTNLLDHPDAAFLGIRGLLQTALDRRDYGQALILARRGLALHPRQSWLLRLAYDLEIRNRHWEEARRILKKAEKEGVVPPSQALADRAAMLLAEADEALTVPESLGKIKKAAALNPDFIPAALRLGQAYLDAGNRRAALRVVEKAWKVHPHPGFIPLWKALVPAKKSAHPAGRLKWLEKLVDLRPESSDALRAVMAAAMESGLWAQAVIFFERAEALHPCADLYRLRADLEENLGGSPDRVRLWLEKAMEALPSPVWFCRETGIIYESWNAIARPHGAFNTIIWGFPGGQSDLPDPLRVTVDGASGVPI
ncbi:MAG: heme biosynthesis protein HemY [Alphaproteobacteria bacterium]|nr:heme biosynthesis protein HemY [Alphaproteobacteria bacterium]